jgi:hypothetical protein
VECLYLVKRQSQLWAVLLLMCAKCFGFNCNPSSDIDKNTGRKTLTCSTLLLKGLTSQPHNIYKFFHRFKTEAVQIKVNVCAQYVNNVAAVILLYILYELFLLMSK